MKLNTCFYILFFSFIFSLGTNMNAQGSLQFNQVRLIKYTDGTQTVPAGKVWKLESVIASSDVASYNISTSGSTASFGTCSAGSWLNYYSNAIMIDGILVPFGRTTGGPVTILPLWLPEGTVLCLSNSTTFSPAAYSVIEFNIVP